MAGINWTKESGWTVENEKTDYKTDHRTDHPTDLTYTVPHTSCWWECSWNGCGRRCRHWTSTHPDHARNQTNRNRNEVNTEKNKDNTALNLKNTKRNDGYQTTVNTATGTRGGDYTTQRQTVRNIQLDSSDTALKQRLEDLYKNYYLEDHIEEWNRDLGRTPLYGEFDPTYYARDTEPGRTANVNWTEAVADDDIDITARYGNEQTYYLQHYTNVAPSGTRGNKAEVTEQANQYIEETPTYQDISEVRRHQLGSNLDTQTER